MIVPAYVRRAFQAWAAWRARQRLYTAVPHLRELDRRQAEDRRRHKAGSRAIAAEKRRVMTERLQIESGRSN